MENRNGATFRARLLRPKPPDDEPGWAFVVLPKAVSEGFPRRGRTSAEGTLNGVPFEVLLEPDGRKSHWFKLGPALMSAAGTGFGDAASFDIRPVAQEPEPEVPADLRDALDACPPARAVWEATTVLARVDWVHWIVSAKQARTRAKRIDDACDMLASGNKRVCCFDSSGVYSKALKAPESLD